METSILIVSKNRSAELKYTLMVLFPMLDLHRHEVLVFLDNCTDSSSLLKKEFPWVKWYESITNLGASAARNALYKNANGLFFIGLDDDAHPLEADFIKNTVALFERFPHVGVITFREIRGVFTHEELLIKIKENVFPDYKCNDFVGCGFAIRKEVYLATNGFPVWIDIYGEESCVSIEVLANNSEIIHTSKIIVNHRVDNRMRNLNKHNYFRFGKQLTNTTYFYIVYFKYPIVKILRLYWHNFRKYAVTDFRYLSKFCNSIFEVFWNFKALLKHRKPVPNKVLELMKKNLIEKPRVS